MCLANKPHSMVHANFAWTWG